MSYTLPGEKLVNSIGKTMVARVRFVSGRVQDISPFVPGKDPDEIVITANPLEVQGMVRKGEVRAQASGLMNFRSAQGTDRKATLKVRRQAIDMGGQVILLLQDKTSGQILIVPNRSFKSGIVYGYK